MQALLFQIILHSQHILFSLINCHNFVPIRSVHSFLTTLKPNQSKAFCLTLSIRKYRSLRYHACSTLMI